MLKEEVVIIGAGPCGLSCAIELKKLGVDALIIEKGAIVNTIYHYPTHQTFFSSSEKLEIGDVAFITPKQKPIRIEALAYYRSVVERKKLRIDTFKQVIEVSQLKEGFKINTINQLGEYEIYRTNNVVFATGYYDQPNMLNIPGEDLIKVSHYFKEAHPYHNKDVVVIGGKNSSIDASLELHKAGANVTILYRGSEYSKSIKPWILPLFEGLVDKGEIKMVFNAFVTEIEKKHLVYQVNRRNIKIKNDFVYAMTGYRPDLQLLEKTGVNINWRLGRPIYDHMTYETNMSGIYIAGVVAAGFNNNKIFIENGRFHGQAIAEDISKKINSYNDMT